MSDLAIRVENLGKQYRLGGQQAGYSTFRETLTNAAKAPMRWLKSGRRSDQNKFWALDDVSFEVKHGEAVGIIGRNGAGKSTLLKILSRITSPTRGRVDIYGRVGSLLEVGTGFHPELTGRENIFLNGAILGMSRSEIAHKFDEIVDFSGIEKFLDTPVKHYSSGMYVRLAFAVAAHLEPEILVVDEVLAVGDAEFQKKCLGKMGDVAKEGRTVLFVSHNMGAISRLCKRSILLQSGNLLLDNTSTKTIEEYIKGGNMGRQFFSQTADETIPLCLLEAEVFSKNKKENGSFQRNEPITVKIKYKVNQNSSSAHVYSSILTSEGTFVFGTGDADADQSRFGVRNIGIYTCQYQIPPDLLNEGLYSINVSLGIPFIHVFQICNEILTFNIIDVGQDEHFMHGRREGVVRIDLPWVYLGNSPFIKRNDS